MVKPASVKPASAKKPATPARTAAKSAAKTAAKSSAKPTAKPATKPAPAPASLLPAAAGKPAASAKPAKPVKAVTPAKPAKTEKADKAEKPRKPKLVRDSFTIPKAEYTVLDDLKQRSATLGAPAKKSELLRAGIKALAAMPDAALRAALAAVPAIKTGRPKAG